jgi:allophanate hydrolase subunit 2
MKVQVYRGFICATHPWDSLRYPDDPVTMWQVHDISNGERLAFGERKDATRAMAAARAKVRKLQ